MTLKRLIPALLVLGAAFALGYVLAAAQSESDTTVPPQLQPQERLVVVWTSGDREVALKMVFVYTYNSRKFGWWDDVTLVVWGPSAKLLSEDQELQDYIKRMAEAGVTLKACKGCADMYGVSEALESLGIEVKYMGELTDYVKEGRHVLTF